MRGFTELETKELIKLCTERKNSKEGLMKAFKEFATEKNRATGSVRNYYYKTLKNAKTEKLRKKLGISKELMPAFIKEFNKAEERELLIAVLSGISLGKSCRAVFIELSEGSEKLALRYQNKYRNLLKNNRPLVENVVKYVKATNGYCLNPYQREEKDDNLKQLEYKIDELIKNAYKTLKNENSALKIAVEMLKNENEKLKKLYKESPIKSYFVAERDDLEAQNH